MGLIPSLIAGSWFLVKLSGRARLIAKPPEQLVVGFIVSLMVGAGAAPGTGCVIGNIISGISLMSVGMVFFAIVVVASSWATTYLYLMGARERSRAGPEPGWHGMRYRVSSWAYFMQKTNLLPELISEFFGTMILMMFGSGVGAMTTLFGTGIPGAVVMGGYTNIILGWGLGVTFGIYAGKLSGAHINPAVTLAFAVNGMFPWRKVAPYCGAQMAGAFAGVALVFFNYRPAFAAFDPGLEKTAGIFTTFPAFPEAMGYGLLDQVVGTALLLFLILAVVEHAPDAFQPITIGLIVTAIGLSFGGMHGYAINPARDLGPRIFVTLAGFPNNGLTDGTGVFWVPIVGPLVGGPLGAFLYLKFLKPYLPRK